MARTRYENVWKLLSEFDFTLNNKVHDEFMCVICKGILRNAFQGPCGCRYCMECIRQYLSGKEKYCPSELEDCDELKIRFERDLQIDYVINKKISIMQVNCPVQGCQVSCQLLSMEQHINSHEEKCPYFPIGCDSTGTGVTDISDHLNSNSYNHMTLLLEYVVDLMNEVANLKETLKLVKKESENKNELLIALNEKLDVMKNYQLDKTINSKLQTETNPTGDNIFNQSKDDELEILNQNDWKTIPITQIKREQINELQSCGKENIGKSVTQSIIYAPYKWIITNFQQRYNDATNMHFKSDTFYSHVNGYKLCLTFHPGGTESGKSSHVSVLIHILNGDHDDQLTWPMKYELKLSFIDHQFGSTISDKWYSYDLVPVNQRCLFDKPSGDKHEGIGDSKWTTPSKLFGNSKIYQNDSIVIRCSINFKIQ